MIKTSVMLMNANGPDGNQRDWIKQLEFWKTLGLEGVDIFHVMLNRYNIPLKDMKSTLDKLGLAPTLYAIPTDLVSPDPEVRAKSLDTVKKGIEACKFLGVDHLFSHGGQHTNEGEEAFARYMDGLAKAADICAEANILFSIENAGKMCNSGESLARTLKEVNRPNMRVTFDGGNFITCGFEPHDAILQLKSSVVHVHVKSHEPAPAGSPRPYKYCPTGVGHPDYRYIRDQLLSAGYDGWFAFEPEGGFDSDWDRSIRTVAEILAEVR